LIDNRIWKVCACKVSVVTECKSIPNIFKITKEVRLIMFSLISGIYEEYFSPPQINLLIIGAQGAGKTALMERLKVIDFSKTGSIVTSKLPSTDSRFSTGFVKNPNVPLSNMPQQQRPPVFPTTMPIRRVPKRGYVFFPDTPNLVTNTVSTEKAISSDNNSKSIKSNNGNEVSSTDDDNYIDENDDDNDSFTNQSIGMSTNDDSDGENTLGNYSTTSGGTLNSKKKIASWKNAKLALMNQKDLEDRKDDDGDTFNGDDESSLKKSRKTDTVQNHHEIELNQNVHDEIRASRRQRSRVIHRRGSGINDNRHQSNSKVKSVSGNGGGSTTSATLTTTTLGTVGSTGISGLVVGGSNIGDTVLNPAATSITTSAANLTSSTASSTVVATAPRSWYAKFCPAPQRYKKYDDDQDEEQVHLFDDDDDDENDVDDEDEDPKRTSLDHNDNKTRPSEYNESFGDGSMESVEFDETTENGTIRNSLSCVHEGKERDENCEEEFTFPDGSSDLDDIPQQLHVEYDLKLNAKMLPLHKINRTIGMNLTKKLSINSANVSVWDLGGKLSDLWERYYADADAVLFVWKINLNQNRMEKSSNDDNSDDDDRSKMILSSEHQLKLLEQVRDSVPDDVPFVIFCHIFDPTTIKDTKGSQKRQRRRRRRYNKIIQYCKTDQLYSITTLLPNHPVVNNCQGIFFGNASTGQGIKTAIEWTIRSAKIQQKIRELQ
jgi:GTPase SAR1 family protein